MSVNSLELVKKLNHVKTSRLMKSKRFIDVDLEFPTSETHEEDMMRDVIFQFLKKKFTGCKLRTNANSISLRLDGTIHRKANKLREIFDREHEWRTWFETNHRNIYSVWRNNRSNWSNGYVQVRTVEDKMFIYVPFKPSRINNYYESSIIPMIQFMENEHTRDQNVAAVYDEAIRLMETEVERRETERRERIERELNEYLTGMKNRLYKPVTQLQESKDPVDRRLAQKLIEWARENGKAPEYVLPATYKEMAPRETKVQVMNQIGSQEENWYVVPVFEGFELPEGYELQEGWGRVTRHDAENERSRNGTAPVVVEEYIFLSFDLAHWKHLLPEGYDELLAITEQFRQEAEVEMAPVIEEEKAKIAAQEAEAKRQAEEAKKLEEEARKVAQERAAEEARRIEEQVTAERARRQEEEREALAAAQRSEEEQRQVEERRRRLAEQLRAQVTQQEVPYTPPQVIPAGEAAEATEQGIYRNMRAIPLERYVAINGEGSRRRFRHQHDAAAWLGYSEGDTIRIRDFHEPHDAVENYTHFIPEPVDTDGENVPF